jgi:hypothetical protein
LTNITDIDVGMSSDLTAVTISAAFGFGLPVSIGVGIRILDDKFN